MSPDIDPVELHALAWRLTDPELTRPPERRYRDALDDYNRIVELMSANVDRITAADALAESHRKWPDDLSALGALARAVVREVGGGAALCAQVDATGLFRVVDTDALVAWGRSGRVTGSISRDLALVGWPLAIRRHGASFESVLAAPMADTHVHLGGAMSTSLLWAFQLGAPESGHPALAGEPWEGGLQRAREALAALRADRHLPEHLEPADTKVGQLLRAVAPERLLLLDAIARARGSTSPAVTRALFTYLRVRHSFHHALTYNEGTRGLKRFRDSWHDRGFFRPRSGAGPDHPDSLRMERERTAQVVEGYLVDGSRDLGEAEFDAQPPLTIELRVSPDRGPDLARVAFARLAGVRDVLRRWRHVDLGVGFVYHFQKTEEPGLEHLAERQADALVSMLEQTPELRPFVVGIDAAHDELAAGPRSFNQAFAHVRRRVDNQGLHLDPPVHLGFTYHTGEDFRDLLTGLRHVEEAGRILGMRAGDRIGHALALAWDPMLFYYTRPSVLPRTRDHALDLLWAWWWLRRDGGVAFLHSVRARERLEALLARAGVRGITTALNNAADLMFQPAVVTDDELLRALELPTDAWKRPYRVDARDAAWVELVSEAQRSVWPTMLERGLVVEVNPSSNLLIGGFPSCSDLPYLRINTVGMPTAGPAPQIPLSINTDDPGFFHSTLRNEFDMVGRSWIRRGLPHREVAAWLDEARRVGVASHFLPRWAPRGPALLARLDRILAGFNYD